MVKADAYGVGLEPVASRLWREGARRFFVARAEEGVALRAALGPPDRARIYVFERRCRCGRGRCSSRHDLVPVLNSLEQVAAWSAAASRFDRRLAAVVQVDTGLNRLGLCAADAETLAAAPERLAGVEVEMVPQPSRLRRRPRPTR